jgi:flagellar biosynthetic protein FliR
MLSASTDLLIAFLLIFARVAGVIRFLPLPGGSAFPAMVKAAVSVLLTFSLLPLARVRIPPDAGAWTISAWTMREAAFGLAVGMAVQFLAETLGLAAQILGFQAGYSYINTVDPSTQVDAAILNVLLTLLGGLLFFSFDVHLHVIRALAWSLEVLPAGEAAATAGWGAALRLVRLGGAALETAVRLAFPIVAVLLLLDLALALLSYVHARMQLLSLSFPIKMLVTMLCLSAMLSAGPRLYHELARQALGAARALAAGSEARPPRP